MNDLVTKLDKIFADIENEGNGLLAKLCGNPGIHTVRRLINDIARIQVNLETIVAIKRTTWPSTREIAKPLISRDSCSSNDCQPIYL